MEIDVVVKPLLDLTDEKSTIQCKSLETRIPRETPHPLPSARYMSLVRNGAVDHQFPDKYLKYLNDLPIYTISTWRTEVGRILFLLIWLPVVFFIFAMRSRSNYGEVPKWLKKFQEWTFSSMWSMHDGYFSRIFGRGDIVSEKNSSLKGRVMESLKGDYVDVFLE
jgi:hypothetical protein